MRWLQLAEVLELHRRLIDQSGGTAGIRDLGLLEASLVLNGVELVASVDSAEAVVLAVAMGVLNREAFTNWVKVHQRPIGPN